MFSSSLFLVFRPLGGDGSLVRFARSLTEAANARALAFCEQAKNASIAGVTEVASSLVSVRVGFDPHVTNRNSVTQAVTKLLASEQATQNSPVYFLQLFGITNVPITTHSIGEAASLDVVIVIDTSESMASDTDIAPADVGSDETPE